MKNSLSAPLLAGLLCLSLSACDSASTNIVEKDSIAKPGDDHEHGHSGEGSGRLVVVSATSPAAHVFSLEDNSLIDTFALDQAPTAIQASAGYRYALLVNQGQNYVEFLDGGLWQEAHLDHFDVYEEAPRLLSYTLTGTRPTHVSKYEGQTAIFYDGNADAPASVQVFGDADITAENTAPAQFSYDINMHGVALPRGDTVFASWRRDNADTTSNTSGANPLPDQVAVYHLHDGVYEQEQILDVACPDLHGAAQNEQYIAFGCSDGVLLVHEHDGEFEAEKILNSEDVATGLRIGTIYGHEHSEQFIGLASAHGGANVQWFVIDPAEGEMELIDWQPVENARVVGRGFTFEAEQFLILDNQGYLTVLEPHEHDGHTHWEFGVRLDITEENVADLPAGTSFNLTVSQGGHTAYVSDPIAQHVRVIDLQAMEIVGDIELDFVPSSIAWLGIAEAHEH